MKELTCLDHLGGVIARILDERMEDMSLKWIDEPVMVSRDMSGYCSVCDAGSFSISKFSIEGVDRRPGA